MHACARDTFAAIGTHDDESDPGERQRHLLTGFRSEQRVVPLLCEADRRAAVIVGLAGAVSRPDVGGDGLATSRDMRAANVSVFGYLIASASGRHSGLKS